MTIEIYSIYPDRGSQGIFRTYKYCVSCIHNWFPYRDDLRSVPIKFTPAAFSSPNSLFRAILKSIIQRLPALIAQAL